MTSLYQASRKMHRILVLVVVVLIIIMAYTGLMLKYGSDTGMLRYIHGNLSLVFTVVLVLMACSGLCLYMYPWYARRKQGKTMQKPAA